MTVKPDMGDGPPDGVPALADIPRRGGTSEVQRAHDRLVQTPLAESGSSIDPPAAQTAGGYSAIVSVSHFSGPAVLYQRKPGIAALLEAFSGTLPAVGGGPGRFPSPASDARRAEHSGTGTNAKRSARRPLEWRGLSHHPG